MNEIFSKLSKKNYPRKNFDVFHIDDTWSMDCSDLNDYGPTNSKGYWYTLVVGENFPKFG